MSVHRPVYYKTKELEHIFRRIIRSFNGLDEISIIDRKKNVYESTSHSEIITCHVNDSYIYYILCKYGAVHEDGHRGGVLYESDVYDKVLRPLNISAPKLYGLHKDGAPGRQFIALSYLDRSVRISKAPQPMAIIEAARWIGKFHALTAPAVSGARYQFVRRYNKKHYINSVNMNLLSSDRIKYNFPWIGGIISDYLNSVGSLYQCAQSIVHSEYYSSNILLKGGIVYPVDWESAAVGAGEIDIASLTDGWPVDIIKLCLDAYACTRCKYEAYKISADRLYMAYVYLHFRELERARRRMLSRGHDFDWVDNKRVLLRLERLRRLGKELSSLRI